MARSSGSPQGLPRDPGDRPARPGWCDMIARFWPVDAVVGENGAFYFRYDRAARAMTRRFWLADDARAADRRRLDVLATEILAAVPGARARRRPALSRSPIWRSIFARMCGPLPPAAVDRIVALMRGGGRHGQGQLDPRQWLVRRLGQAGDDPPPVSRGLRHRSRPASARPSRLSATCRTTSRCSPFSRTASRSPMSGRILPRLQALPAYVTDGRGRRRLCRIRRDAAVVSEALRSR